jgi:hypothetical protein
MHTEDPSKPPTLTWMYPSGRLRRWPPSRVPQSDALSIFLRWRVATQLGHKTVAAAALAELEELAERPGRPVR